MMNLQQLLTAIRAEGADSITINASGSAALWKDGAQFLFHSLDDLEKSFSQSPREQADSQSPAPDSAFSIQPSALPSADPCTCDAAHTLLQDCLAYIEKKSPTAKNPVPSCNCDSCALKQKLSTFLANL